MCELCETDEELEDCAYDHDEKHPDQWSGTKPTDSNDRKYVPYQGSQSPTEDRCNAMLSAWEDRYDEPRYCMRLPEDRFVSDGSDFCKVHKQREGLMERASDAFTHGLYSKTIRHTYDKLSAVQKLTVLGFYDSYTQESTFNFDVDLEQYQLDFADYDGELPIEITADLDDEGQLSVGVPIPTDHQVRAFALYRAALMDMKVSLADRETLPDPDDDLAAMEKEQIIEVVTDDEGNVEDTYTADLEHHLNVPISRADGDREDLLVFGGVPLEGNADIEMNVDSPEDLILDLDGSDAETAAGDTNPVEDAMIDAADGDEE